MPLPLSKEGVPRSSGHRFGRSHRSPKQERADLPVMVSITEVSWPSMGEGL